MAMDFIGLSVGMGYTDETVIGGGALKGKNCVVSNIEEVADGVNVTFQWTLDNGTVQTETVLLPKGTQGETGVDGKSAYEIWLEAGNTGTEEDFLISLVGEKGADGKSAYQYAQDGGYIGTETEFTTNIARSGVISKELEVERARIDNLTTLQDGSTTGDAELLDARLDYSGKTWENVGEHIRGITEFLLKHCVGREELVSEGNYEELGISDITDFVPNKIYSINSNITSEMISNLPKYNLYATLITLKPYNGSESTGFTVYLYVSSTFAYINFSHADGLVGTWKSLKGNDNCLVVGKNGNFKTINSAIPYAKDGDIIFIQSGVYNENISVTNKTLHFVGENKDSVIIKDTSGDYRTPPFEISSGSIENMTIIETGEGTVDDNIYNKTAYCIHSDFDYQENKTLRLSNLKLVNGCHACIGVGVRDGFQLIIDNVEMEMTQEQSEVTQRGCLYIHSFSDNKQGRAKLLMRNSIVRSATDLCVTYQPVGNSTIGIDFEHINNTFIGNNSVENSIIQTGYGANVSFGSHFVKMPTSHGNNISSLNQ